MEDDELVRQTKHWVRQHKTVSVLLLIALIAAGVFAWNLFSGFGATFAQKTTAQETSRFDRGVADTVPSIGEAGGGEDDFQVRTGHATIESENAAADVETFRGKVTSLNGDIEEEEKTTTESETTYYLTARIPVEDFDTFATWLRDTYTVEDMSLRVDTISVEQQRNQVHVLRQALQTYDNLLAKLNRSNAEDIDADTVQAIAEITEKKQHVAQELERLGYNIGEVEERAAMATVRVTFREEKPVTVTPEDTGRRFKLAWKHSVDNLVGTAADLSTVPVTAADILLQVFTYIIYAFVVVIPVYGAYRGLRWTIKKLSRIGRE